MMTWKKLVVNILSFFLILVGGYQMIFSLQRIFFLYPHLHPSSWRHSLLLQEGLIEKAFILYLTMVVDGFYGLSLLFKPIEKIKLAHLIAGLLIALFSVSFITETSLTTDPLMKEIRQFFKR